MSDMGNESPWSRQFKCHKFRLNEVATEWKGVMNDILVHSDILSSSDVSRLKMEDPLQLSDPRLLMDLRHAQVAAFKPRLPRETIITEARRMIRKEKLERLAQERELYTVNREIEALRDRISKQRAKYAKNVTPSLRRNETVDERLGVLETCQRIDSWFTNTVKTTIEKSKKSSPEMKMMVILTPKSKKSQPELNVEEISPNPEIVEISPIVKDQECKGEIHNEQQKVSPDKCRLPSIQSKVNQNRILEIKFKIIKYRYEERLKRRLLSIWRRFVMEKKLSRESSVKEQKIEQFLSRLKEMKLQSIQVKLDDNNCENREKEKKHSIQRTKTDKKIKQQRTELSKQKEIENNATLEKIEIELQNSTETTYSRLRKSMKDFDPRLKGKVRLLRTSSNIGRDRLEQIEQEMRKIMPPPEVLLRMEARNRDRHERWEKIKEKKRLMEQEKEKQKREAEEKKRVEEIEEKKRKLEEYKERRRLEREAEEERRREMKRMMELNQCAQKIYREKLLRRFGLEPWRQLVVLRHNMWTAAGLHYEKLLIKQTFTEWRNVVFYESCMRNLKAVQFYNKLLKRKCFQQWINIWQYRQSQFQVAADWFDNHLLVWSIKNWLEFVQNEQMLALKRTRMAEEHYRRTLLESCINKWKHLPAVNQYEREKEDRKRVWRYKVQQFLPDFRPVVMTDEH